MRKRNQMMSSIFTKLDARKLGEVSSWLFPLSFVFSSFINLGFFYIGLAFEDNPIRSAGYILGCIAFAVVSAVVLALALYSNPLRKSQWVLEILSACFFVFCLVYGVLRNGFGSTVFGYLKVFIVLVIPAFFTAGLCGIKRGEAAFFRNLEQTGFFCLPVVLVYVFWAVFNCNPFYRGIYLGFMNYMSFAYTIMPVLLAHIQQFSVEAPLRVPFLSRELPHPQVFRGIVIVLYWLAIIASGTRGAYVCVAVYCVFLFVNRLIRKQPAKRFFALAALLASILLFMVFIYTPPGFSSVGRMSSFVQGLAQGEFSTSDMQAENIDEQIDDMLDGKITVSNQSQNAARPNTPQEAPNADSRNEALEGELLNPDEEMQPVISDRSTYYKLAFGEFSNAPLFGIGPGGYSQKYAAYPHNIVLEILCETGLAGTLFLGVLMLLAVVRILKYAICDENVCHILLFLMVYFIQANISGSVWQNATLLCFLGYGFALPPIRKK